MIPKSSVILLGSVLLVFFFFSALGMERAGDTKGFFIVGIFSDYQLKICTEIQLVCLLHF